jgi:hypothetical protein
LQQERWAVDPGIVGERAFAAERGRSMAQSEARYPGGASWSIDDVPYHALERERVKDNTLLLDLVATASFVEITSDVYTRNLADFFRGDAEVVDWLEHAWESEELQHGKALKRYVETAWPEFDWEGAYRNFLAEFLRFCSVDQLAETRALEMAARCVVETGTATLYRAVSEASPEPVLRLITAAISADEVRHYKNFYRFFLRYRESEQPSRTAVARTLWARISEVDAEDAFYAFKHVYLGRNPQAEFHEDAYAAFRAQLRPLTVRHFPHKMASKMLLKPLGLSAPVGRLVVPAVASASRLLLLR